MSGPFEQNLKFIQNFFNVAHAHFSLSFQTFLVNKDFEYVPVFT